MGCIKLCSVLAERLVQLKSGRHHGSQCCRRYYSGSSSAISRDCPELQALGAEVVVEGNFGAVCTVQVEGAEGEGSLESDHGGESS